MQSGIVSWYGLRQWCKITRTRTQNKSGATSTEIVYMITSLPISTTTPGQLLNLNRKHWGIENKLHWVKDTLLREDASTIRTRNAPQAVATLRNLTLKLLKNIHKSPTIAREICTRNISNAINQLLI
jgi:predicted transposase YbfD/YdcC